MSQSRIQSFEENGDNILHNSLRHTALRTPHILSVLEQNPSLDLTKLSRETNDHGELPVDILLQTNSPEDDDVIKVITQFMIIGSKCAISDDVKINSDDNNPILHSAAHIGNLTRSVLKKSLFHPQTNEYTVKEKLDLLKQTLQLENEFNHFLETQKIDYLKTKIELAEKYHIGDSEAFAFYALHLLKNQHPKLNVEIYHIPSCNYYVLAIGRQFQSNPSDYHSWNDSTIILDPLLGNVCSLKKINTLTLCRQYKTTDDNFINVATPFNPHAHLFQFHFSLETKKLLQSINALSTSGFYSTPPPSPKKIASTIESKHQLTF